MNDEEVKEAVAKTVRKVLMDVENEKKKQERQKVLHNTRMLMENYREMRRHLENAISEVEELEAEEFRIFKTGEAHLESIRRSKLCTAMMIANIDRAMEELKAERSYSEQDAFLALKDILAGVWKSRQAQPPENT